jgi:hypothetical protein
MQVKFLVKAISIFLFHFKTPSKWNLPHDNYSSQGVLLQIYTNGKFRYDFTKYISLQTK